MDTMLTVREAAERVHVTPRTMTTYIKNGIVKSVKVEGTGRRLIREGDLAEAFAPKERKEEAKPKKKGKK
jgi:excisionase family DNA binding protein